MSALQSEIQIRRAKPEEAALVAKVLYESFAEYESLYTPVGFEATTPRTEQVIARMRQGPLWIAFLEHEVVGTVAAVVKGSWLYVRGMAVLPTARRSGVGARLLKQIESCAADEGCSRIILSTTPFLDAAIRLYEKFGFRRVNEEPQQLFGTQLFTMEKSVFERE